ncbi:hypothetical protein Zmor_012369 [Zophobas morio]|uniref:AAA+ ATPase domain-containing protein n=1 Tax=Zophobas morio TaxID=2755281 RepID=A0AA38HHW4_9CUCU|nr:hypothetical protein Zmor_012369 [Zophobas morio]
MLGFVPPKGLLLYGPPGTGKTLIAKAIANEMRVNFITINATEVLAKFYGQSEAKLRSVFHTAAQSSPCIIFIDEVDALCPKREHAETEVEKRVVTTMLSLLDSISNGEKQNCRVVVIGATNAPDRLDSALRRPGRFDREIEIGIPNSKQRLCILKRLLAKTPHTVSDSQLESISALMHGYVGADVSSLCKEAGLLAVKRTMCSTGEEDSAGLSDLVVTEADLRKALTLVRPSAMRAVVVDVPQVYWSDIGGQEDTKQKLREAVTWPLLHPEAFLRMGIRPPKGVLLYGPPGCSKTLLAKALATESQLNFISVKSSDLFSKWVGESEKAMKEFFRKARAASPCIIFFDELDAIAGKRGRDSGENSVADRVLTQLLNELDGVEPLKNVTFLAASNRPDAIDPALMRPGRIDRILFVAPPDESSRREIFTIHLKKMPNDLTDVEVDELARKTSFFSGAEIVAVCREAAMEALRRVSECFSLEFTSHRFFTKYYRITTPLV